MVSGGGSEPANAQERQARIEAEARRIKPIADAAYAIGCSVALYNHGGWFGEPPNQIEIIEKLRILGVTNAGIVYIVVDGWQGWQDQYQVTVECDVQGTPTPTATATTIINRPFRVLLPIIVSEFEQ